jgi:hypothetical protein
MGEVTGLRLELGRERDRADALAGALHKEVVAVIRRAVADVDTVGAQLVELDDVKAENARLKAEVEKWKSWAEAEHAEKKVVKAEVELTKCKSEADHQLKAELERIYRLDPLLREAIASAVLASKGGRP